MSPYEAGLGPKDFDELSNRTESHGQVKGWIEDIPSTRSSRHMYMLSRQTEETAREQEQDKVRFKNILEKERECQQQCQVNSEPIAHFSPHSLVNVPVPSRSWMARMDGRTGSIKLRLRPHTLVFAYQT